MYQAQSKQINIKTEYFGFPSKDSRFNGETDQSKMSFFIISDEKRIKQVLMNLQSNALKFTREGGTIRIIAEYIQAGSGLARNKIPDYFDDFSDSDDS